MNLFLSVLLVLIQGLRVVPASSYTQAEIATFVSDNGFKYVDLLAGQSNHYQGILLRLLSMKTQHYIRCHHNLDYKEAHKRFHVDVSVFLVRKLEDITADLLTAVAENKIQRTIVVVMRSSTSDKDEAFRDRLQMLKLNTLFYLSKPDNRDTTESAWYQVITLKNGGHAQHKLKFRSGSRLIEEHYDLQGLTLRSIGLTWSPYLTVDECNEKGEDCAVNSGFFVDAMNELSKKFNFTFTSDRDPNGDWGVLPKSGPFNRSGEWGGVLGDVVEGRFHMSLTPWTWLHKRRDVLDFVQMIKQNRILVWEPVNPEVDFGLFLRPITAESWVAILATALVILSCIVFVKFSLPLLSGRSESSELMIVTLYYFFVLINAFYGGALTMFFIGTGTIPFENLRDVLRAHPEWTLRFMKGNDAHFAYPALQVSLSIFCARSTCMQPVQLLHKCQIKTHFH